MSRERTVNSQNELEEMVEEYVQKGYNTKVKGDEAYCKKSGFGSIWWHIFFLFLTAGIGNVIYAAYVRFTADSVVIKIE